MAKTYPKVKYKVSVLGVFERAFADKDAKARAKMRPLLSSATFLQKFGEELIDRIVMRTLKGIDKNDVPFQPYSESYVESYQFKLYGKSEKRVNLRLSGQMLASMKVSKGSLEVTIWIPDEFNNSKAHGHINGPKKRDFLGLPTDQEIDALKKVIKKMNSDTIENLIDFEKTDLGSFTFKEETVTPLGTTTTKQAVENTFTPAIANKAVIDGE